MSKREAQYTYSEGDEFVFMDQVCRSSPCCICKCVAPQTLYCRMRCGTGAVALQLCTPIFLEVLSYKCAHHTKEFSAFARQIVALCLPFRAPHKTYFDMQLARLSASRPFFIHMLAQETYEETRVKRDEWAEFLLEV